MLTSSKKESREPIERGLEEKGYGQSTADPPCFRCIENLCRRSTTLQDLGSGHAGSGVIKKQLNEHENECQVACTSKHTCIDKSKSESIHTRAHTHTYIYTHTHIYIHTHTHIKIRVVNTGTHKHAMRQS